MVDGGEEFLYIQGKCTQKDRMRGIVVEAASELKELQVALGGAL